jgi:hypothetical protein
VLNWILSIAGAAVVVALLYRDDRRAGVMLASGACRFVAVLLAIALALDAPRGRAGTRAPFVAVDASASWLRGRSDTAWSSAIARARQAAGADTVWLFGDSLRPLADERAPRDVASRIENAVDRALGAGRPMAVITDGEIDDPRALERLMSASRVDVAPPTNARDAAVLGLEMPRSAVAGDSITILVRLSAGAAGVGAGSVAVTMESASLARIPVDSMPAWTERDVSVNVRVPPAGPEHRVVRAALSVAADVVAANDTLAAVLDVASAPRAVFVSTAPDQDSRFSLEILRGTLAIAVRAFYRVAPNVWRQEPGLTPATEADVRAALASAPIAVLHGDTALFGAPRDVTSGALALIPPTSGDGDEWYAVSAPVSPISSSLAGLPWDSLAPVTIGGAPRGDWTGLTVRRRRTQRDERAIVAGSERPRRVAVVAASGLWRWRFRGGVGADAYSALWGGVFDWLAAGGDDRRAAVPAAAWSREGEPIVWRRGARRDSVVRVVVRRSGTPRVDTMTLKFPGDAILAESQPMAAGEYDVTMPGGSTRLFVGASREWLPRRASVEGGPIGSGEAAGLTPRLRDAWWAYVVLLAALCAEWLLRRRAGRR